MISSIILLLIQHFKFADLMPWPLWFKFMGAVIIEMVLYIVGLKKLDEWDIKTNYGRNKK